MAGRSLFKRETAGMFVIMGSGISQIIEHGIIVERIPN
jgi:hypothetical protein